MANVIAPMGFTPTSYINGAPWNGQARLYAIPTTDTTASYAIGDVVQSASGTDADGIPYCVKVPAANAANFVALGVVVGVRVADPTNSLVGSSLLLEQLYITAGTRAAVRYVYVADDPNLIFEVSAGATATNLTAANAHKNAGIGSFYSGADQTYAIDQTTYLSPSAPQSNVIITSASINTTNTLPVRLLGIVQRPNNLYGAYARYLCKFNTHEFGVGTGTNFTGV
jgi:hypothetical protein